MKTQSICFFMVLLISYCTGAVDFDFLSSPCSIKDEECIVGLWQNAVRSLATGRPDLDIPPLDPLKLDNIVVNVPGLVNMHFDGVIKGFKSCIFDRARTSLKQGRYKEALDLHCNVSIKGHYDVNINSTVLLGKEGLLRANGDGKVKLDNLFFKFLMDFRIIRDDDGVVKFVLKDGPMGYKYKVNGPVEFAANNIYFGSQDISPFFVTLINQNWKFVLDAFGAPFFQKAMEIVGDFERSFLKHVSASSYFIENLDNYVEKI